MRGEGRPGPGCRRRPPPLQGRTGDGIQVRQVCHLQWRLEAELGDGHIAHAVDEYERQPLWLRRRHTVPWADPRPLSGAIGLHGFTKRAPLQESKPRAAR